jgi:hypothetical protein
MSDRLGAAAVYFALVLLASLGTIGLVEGGANRTADRSRMARLAGPLLSWAAIAPALIAFFLGEDYFHAGLVQGAEQAGLFSGAAVSAVALHAVAAALGRHIHGRRLQMR